MKLIFLPGPGGALMPLQKVRFAYIRHKDQDGDRVEIGLDSERMYANHFETCPEASKFSKRSRG